MGGQLCRHVCSRRAESGDALDVLQGAEERESPAASKACAQGGKAVQLAVAALLAAEASYREEAAAASASVAPTAEDAAAGGGAFGGEEPMASQRDISIADDALAESLEGSATGSTRSTEEEEAEEEEEPHQEKDKEDVEEGLEEEEAEEEEAHGGPEEAPAEDRAAPMTTAAGDAPPQPFAEKVVRWTQAFTGMVGHCASVLATGRLGRIVEDDASELPYKIRFADGALPHTDWFKACDVELRFDVGCTAQMKGTGRRGLVVAVDDTDSSCQVLFTDDANRYWFNSGCLSLVAAPKLFAEDFEVHAQLIGA